MTIVVGEVSSSFAEDLLRPVVLLASSASSDASYGSLREVIDTSLADA